MDDARIAELMSVYRDGLLEDTLPFWLSHAVDGEHGGFLICLDRDGSILDTDKGMWQQCRFTWLLATLYNTVERREEWRHLAAHGMDFVRRFGFDRDGRMFFLVTQDGQPLRRRRYVFTETFAVIALAAYARASGEAKAAEQAEKLFGHVQRWLRTPGALPGKRVPGTRPTKSMVVPMILMATAQVLRECLDSPAYNSVIDACIDEIRRDFMKPELRAVMEAVGPAGELLDHFDERLLNPGHAIEGAWFILHEARCRGGDAELIRIGTDILDWMWERGWDPQYGGLFYYRDLRGLPVAEYWQDMKFWWPHNETIIATLLAHHLTGEPRYAQWHAQIHDWAYRHFPDPEYGEWFGYLHRDGTPSVRLKGNIFKGPFHLPRMQWYCWQLLEAMRSGRAPQA